MRFATSAGTADRQHLLRSLSGFAAADRLSRGSLSARCRFGSGPRVSARARARSGFSRRSLFAGLVEFRCRTASAMRWFVATLEPQRIAFRRTREAGCRVIILRSEKRSARQFDQLPSRRSIHVDARARSVPDHSIRRAAFADRRLSVVYGLEPRYADQPSGAVDCRISRAGDERHFGNAECASVHKACCRTASPIAHCAPEYNTADASLWWFVAAHDSDRADARCRASPRDFLSRRAATSSNWHQARNQYGIRRGSGGSFALLPGRQ